MAEASRCGCPIGDATMQPRQQHAVDLDLGFEGGSLRWVSALMVEGLVCGGFSGSFDGWIDFVVVLWL